MRNHSIPRNPKVLIVGGGFGGLYAAQALSGTPLDVTLVDKRNFHLFQPLLYQVATGGLSPADIASPLRYVLRKQRNATVLLEEVADFRPDEKTVLLRGRELDYDYLVVAAGARKNYFGNISWSEHAPGLKDLEDAREIRHRVLSAFEAAEREVDPGERERWLTFVVIGGGATGVELAGAIAELARETLPNDFRRIDTRSARIILIEGGDRILPLFSENLSEKAESSLERLGVEVWTNSLVSSVSEHAVRVQRADREMLVESCTALWAAGVSASPLGRALSKWTGTETDSAGRVVVEADCSVPGYPEIFVIGDLARLEGKDGRPLPGLAPVAMQQGRYVASVIANRARCRTTTRPFRYRDRGDLATVGRSRAVARVGRFEFSGYPAWVMWLFVHLLHLVEFQNRLLVLLQWTWSYLTWNRSARIITRSSRDSVSLRTPRQRGQR